MNILHHLINMYMQWEEKTGIRLWKVGVKEAKISSSEYKFLLQKKKEREREREEKKKQFLKHVLIWKSKFASLSSVSPAQFGNSQECIYLNHRESQRSRIHCDRSTTNWSKHASSALDTWLLSPLMCIKRLATSIQLHPLHLNSLYLFLVWSEKQASFFFFPFLFFFFFFLPQNPLGEVDFMVSIIMHL